MKGFYWLSKAWYGDANRSKDRIDEIMIGDYETDSGTGGEFAIRWMSLSDKIVPRIEAFSDSWVVMNSYTELLEHLALLDGEDPTPEQISSLLINLGFKDLTPYEDPYKSKKVVEYLACKEDGLYCGSSSVEEANQYFMLDKSDKIAVYKISHNPDGTDPQIERVDD